MKSAESLSTTVAESFRLFPDPSRTVSSLWSDLSVLCPSLAERLKRKKTEAVWSSCPRLFCPPQHMGAQLFLLGSWLVQMSEPGIVVSWVSFFFSRKSQVSANFSALLLLITNHSRRSLYLIMTMWKGPWQDTQGRMKDLANHPGTVQGFPRWGSHLAADYGLSCKPTLLCSGTRFHSLHVSFVRCLSFGVLQMGR